MNAMPAEHDRGEALQLVDSLGDVWGSFCVTGITEARRDIGSASLSLRTRSQVTLRDTEVNRQEPRALAAVPSQFSLQAG